MIKFLKNIFGISEKLYQDLNTQDFKSKINSSSILIDVRTPAEFKSGKISGAKNINVASFDFMKEVKRMDSSKEVLVYCRSGARSARAAKMIIKLGFEKVSNLEGGVLTWQRHGEKLV